MTEKIIAAVPTYNAGDNLAELAGQLTDLDFDKIYILDDKSTDGSVASLKTTYPNLEIIEGQENKGPAGNRNRLLDLIDKELVVFIDADMRLEPGNIPQAVQQALGQASVGLVGGLILDKRREPMGWNYGFEMHPVKDAWFWQIFKSIVRDDITDQHREQLIQELREAEADYNWVYPKTLPLQARQVDWVAEGLFAIRAELFTALSGYDENMRYHEGQDLARRVRDTGHTVVFNPSFSAHHQEIQVRQTRQNDFTEGQFYFFNKHWGMSRQVFDELYS